jgi:hypothetical protein
MCECGQSCDGLRLAANVRPVRDNWRFVTSAVLTIPHIAGTSELIDADRLGTKVITLEALQ